MTKHVAIRQNQNNDMKTAIVPTLRYKDSVKAIDWLSATFGFEEHLVVPSESGGITHAQLVYRTAMIMLGGGHRDADDPFGRLNKSPLQLDGCSTAGIYMIVEDVDATMIMYGLLERKSFWISLIRITEAGSTRVKT